MKQNQREKTDLNPLPALAVCFILGIAFAHILNFKFYVYLELCALTIALGFILRNYPQRSGILLLTTFFFLGSSVLANREVLSARNIKNVLGRGSYNARIRGTVISPPAVKKSRTGFIIALESLCLGSKVLNASGKIYVQADADFVKNISYSDVVSLSGKIYRPFNFYWSNEPGVRTFDYRLYLARQDIYFIFSPDKDYKITISGPDKRYTALKIINNISEKLNSRLFTNLPDISATFYSAFLLGRREAAFQDLNEIFIKTGTAHILAISGMNVAIVAMIFFWFFKAIGFKRRPRYIFTLAGLVFYCILTGMNPPVVRSTIMAVFIIVGLLLEREGNIYNSLSLAALSMLTLEPRYIFDIGFQLSFTAVLGIVTLTPHLIDRLTFIQNKACPGIEKNKALLYSSRSFIFAFSVSFAAILSVEPLIVYYFKIITPVALLANIIVVPLLTFIQVSGTALLALALVLPIMAQSAAYACGIQTAVLINIVYLLSRIPGAYFYVNFQINVFWVFLYYGLLICLVIWLNLRRKSTLLAAGS